MLDLARVVDRLVHVLDQLEAVVHDLALPAGKIAFKGTEEGLRHVHAGRLDRGDLLASSHQSYRKGDEGRCSAI